MSNDQPKILITGGTGFAGSHLVEFLQSQGHQNVHVTTFSGSAGYVGKLLPSENIHQADLTEKSQTDHIFESLKPDHVYHLAAFADVGGSFEKAALVMQNNTSLQLNVMEAVRQFCPDARVLSVGSALQYGMVHENDMPVNENQAFKPVNPYAVSKVSQELIAYMYQQMHGLNIVMVRAFNHVGERQTTAFAISAFASQIVAIEKGQQDSIKVGNLEAKRDISDVKDVVAAYSLILEKGEIGEVYNVGSGHSYRIQDLLDKLVSMSSVNVKVETDPERIRPVDIPVMVADISKLNNLGWQPQISIDETLNRVLEWHRREIISNN